MEMFGSSSTAKERVLSDYQDLASCIGQMLIPGPNAAGKVRFAVPILGWRECVLGQLTRAQSKLGLITNWNERTVSDSDINDAWWVHEAPDVLGDRFYHVEQFGATRRYVSRRMGLRVAI